MKIKVRCQECLLQVPWYNLLILHQRKHPYQIKNPRQMFLLEMVFSHGSKHKNRMQNKKDQKKGNFHLECSDRSRFETTGQVMSDMVVSGNLRSNKTTCWIFWWIFIRDKIGGNQLKADIWDATLNRPGKWTCWHLWWDELIVLGNLRLEKT